MEGEINNFIMVWALVFLSVFYCFAMAKRVSKGIPRLILIIPAMILFFLLPLNLNSVNLGGPTVFFITWLANFKLLLLALGHGPLADPRLSLGRFVIVCCFPLKVQQRQAHVQLRRHEKEKKGSEVSSKSRPPKSPKNSPKKKESSSSSKFSEPSPLQNRGELSKRNSNSPKVSKAKLQRSPITSPFRNESSPHKALHNRLRSPIHFAKKGLVLVLLVHIDGYKKYLHANVFSFLICIYIYTSLDVMLGVVGIIGQILLGVELEPPFDDPYLSSSLKDFWGRRWNRMSTDLLRSMIFKPIMQSSSRIVGRKWAPLPAVLATFLVSALMHDLLFFYLGHGRPTLGTTFFFLFHGVCLAVEGVLRERLNERWRLPQIITGPLVFGFVIVTFMWLILPQLIECGVDKRAVEEYAALGTFLRSLGQSCKEMSYKLWVIAKEVIIYL